MASVADYKVLFDGVFELDGDSTVDRHKRLTSIAIPSNFVHGTNLAKPVLAFIVRPVVDSRLIITIHAANNPSATEILDTVFKTSSRRGFWEAFSGEILQNNSQFTIHFQTSPGQRVRISNVVLWYQVEI